MLGERGVYALFMKMDDDKYGFFMRLGPNGMGVVAELSTTLPIKDSRA
jgi:hypothetical protein